MPTQNRSSTIEQHDHIEGIIDMVSVPRKVIEFAAGLKWHGYKSGTDQKDDQLQALNKLRAILAAPAPQPHPDPLAWMVGTAIWWTKEEAERDAAETGLPIVGLGPMTGAAPAEQQQGEPVAWLAKTLKGSLAGSLGLARYDQRLNPELYDGPFPVFRHADPGEVERLREGIAKHWKVVCDQRAEIESLRDQLAKAHGLLRKIEGYHWAKVEPEERARTRAELRDLLSASEEPQVKS